jgi:pyruvate dehydrogenase E1 component
VDGEFQTYAATDGRFNREHFFNKYPELQALVADLSDEDIDRLKRGGHDPVKIHAAYHAALHHRGRPTVILAQTKKGYGMGTLGPGQDGHAPAEEARRRGAAGVPRPLCAAALRRGREGAEVPSAPGRQPGDAYLHARRQALGGYLPARSARGAPKPPSALVRPLKRSRQSGREQSTTMVFVQLLTQLLRDAHARAARRADRRRRGAHLRHAGLFRQVGIYSPVGQLYEPEDRDELLYYKEAQDGQILEEGITEAGALSSWIAAATSYSTHGVPMLPFYIFYSMFGFQRVGDLIWAAADSRARGFLVGATAGRTTLSGEGLQHQDGRATSPPPCPTAAPTTLPSATSWR